MSDHGSYGKEDETNLYRLRKPVISSDLELKEPIRFKSDAKRLVDV